SPLNLRTIRRYFGFAPADSRLAMKNSIGLRRDTHGSQEIASRVCRSSFNVQRSPFTVRRSPFHCSPFTVHREQGAVRTSVTLLLFPFYAGFSLRRQSMSVTDVLTAPVNPR